MSDEPTSARNSAIDALKANAAEFARPPQPTPIRPVPAPVGPRAAVETDTTPVSASPPSAAASDDDPASRAGYVPVAVAPERGNTRPVVPVDGRLHMRVAQATLDALDEVVGEWKSGRPDRRDLERATLVRIGLAMLLADVREHGEDGAVGEAVAAALDPAVRHTATPMPSVERWLRPREEVRGGMPDGGESSVPAEDGSRQPD